MNHDLYVKLYTTAFNCHNGACNVNAIIHALSVSIQGMDQDEVKNSTCVKYILNHLLFLCGVGIGRDEQVMTEFINLMNTNDANSKESTRVTS